MLVGIVAGGFALGCLLAPAEGESFAFTLDVEQALALSHEHLVTAVAEPLRCIGGSAAERPSAAPSTAASSVLRILPSAQNPFSSSFVCLLFPPVSLPSFLHSRLSPFRGFRS